MEFYAKLLGFPIFRFLAYLMKVILETSRAHWIWYLRFYYYHRVDTSAGGLSPHEYHPPSSQCFETDKCGLLDIFITEIYSS